MKMSLGLVTAMQVKDSIELANAAEEAGYHRVWIGEDIFQREIFTYISILALHTERIALATGVTSPYVRNAHVLAASGLAVSKLCKGRFTFGLGVGGLPEIEKLTGEKPKKPVEVLENTVAFLRKKLDIEIYLGVRGPRMLKLAGRVADGVILSGPKGYIEKAIEIVEDAAGGRRVKKVLWNAFHLGEDPKRVSKITKVMLESMPGFALKYMEGKRPEDELCIHGSKDQILEEMKWFEERGVDEFIIGPPFGKEPLKVVVEMGRIWRSA